MFNNEENTWKSLFHGIYIQSEGEGNKHKKIK